MSEPKVKLCLDHMGSMLHTSQDPTSEFCDICRLAARVEALLDARQADCKNIQRMQARVEELEGQKAKIIGVVEEVSEEVIAELEAENTRLREALERIRAECRSSRPDIVRVYDAANDALKEKP